MSKEENSKQMSLLEAFPASQCRSQENKKEQVTTDISGQKCLESLGKSNPNSLLGRMCKELLTSKTAWYSKIKGRNIEIATGQQERPNETTEPERTSGSRDNENVSNTESVSSNEREPRNSEEKSREERQVRNEVRGNDGHGVTKDVSDTSKIRSSSESIRDIESLGEESNREKETGNQSSVCIETRSSNVSNTDSGLRRGRTAIGESGENKVWRFYSEEEEQPRVNIRSQTIGRNVVYGSTQSWWQIESEFCRVPNGISYELDKNRAKRIKALGNAIVPQIAREIGLAIMKVASNE
jgi:site-specific DNA-cytosine methylase